MASSSVSPRVVIHRNISLSPTIVHHHQKQQTFEIPPLRQHDRRRGRRRRRHHHPKQQTRGITRTIPSSFGHEQNSFQRRETTVNKRYRSPRFGSAASFWEVHRSSTGRKYYYNVVTDRSQWERPSSEHRSTRKNTNESWRQSKRVRKKNSCDDDHPYERDLMPAFGNSRRKSSASSVGTSDDGIDSALLRQANYHSSSHFSTKHRSRISESILLDTNTTNNPKRHHRKHHHHHKRKKYSLENKSLFKSHLKEYKLPMLTPTSPPADEMIGVDRVDPVLTPSLSISDIAIPPVDPRQRHAKPSVFIANVPSKSVVIDEKILQLLHRKRLPPPIVCTSSLTGMQINRNSNTCEIPSPINDLSSIVARSSLRPSASTIDAIFELGHSFSVTSHNSDDITRYYRGELIGHLLNWPSTQIERETARLSNEQARVSVSQLVALRTEIFSIRLRFERNRIQLIQYQHALAYRQQVIETLRLIDQDQQQTSLCQSPIKD